jgi:hypothetical protein
VIQDKRVKPAEALTKMQEAAALWSLGELQASELVDVACDLLVAGYDGPNLAMLAGIHSRNADVEVPELLEAALADLGLDYYLPGSPTGQEAVVRIFASRVVAGLMPPMDLAVWAHSNVGHDGLTLASRLVELDDIYDTLDYTDMTEQDVNDEILAEARRILATPRTCA